MSKETQIEEMRAFMLAKSNSANVEPVFTTSDGKEIVLGQDLTKLLNDVLEQAFIPFLAEALYNAGYRKQSEGHWDKDEVGETLCSQCGVRPLYRKSGTTFATTFYPTRSNYCPNCGAKMKGGAE